MKNNLYFILGSLPMVFFSLRFLIQWIQTEKEKKSTTPPIFWKLSFVGNFFSLVHFFIQAQIPFFVSQIVNLAISKRQISLLKEDRVSLSRALLSFALFFLLLSLSFLSYLHLSYDNVTLGTLLFPKVSWIKTHDTALLWHILGAIGLLCSTARFWVNWVQSEKRGTSELNKPFWIISLVGYLLITFYAVIIRDVMSLAAHVFGAIPVLRNLWMMRQSNVLEKS